jgi:transcriptional regulator with XRE-family HTH domain
MLRSNVPRTVRLLRRHHGWRQADLGRRAQLSRDTISRCEIGRFGGVTIDSLDRIAEALGAHLVVELRWQGADLDRLVDGAHAAIVEAVAARLRVAGWAVQPEVSFNHYGDRGSCDLVARHSSTRMLLVVEAKTALGNIQETLRRLDVKARIAPILAEQLGWPAPTSVARALVILATRTNRRIVERHAETFSVFPTRGRAATNWLRQPAVRPDALMWFQLVPDSAVSRSTPSGRVRLRTQAG